MQERRTQPSRQRLSVRDSLRTWFSDRLAWALHRESCGPSRRWSAASRTLLYEQVALIICGERQELRPRLVPKPSLPVVSDFAEPSCCLPGRSGLLLLSS